MEKILFTLKQIKCKECKGNLEILRGYDDGDLFCSCNYINYFFALFERSLHISSINNIYINLISMYIIKNEIVYSLNKSDLFDELNTGLIFNKSLLFNISEIEKVLNIYSGIERNLIFK